MNWSIFPSESHVMSPSTPRRVGASNRRWIGMIGKSWFTAQLSGIDWKIEKLQKYVSDSIDSSPWSSSGTYSSSRMILSILPHTAQKSCSANERNSMVR